MSLWCCGSPVCNSRVFSSFLWCPLEFNQNFLTFAPLLLLFTNHPWYLYIALLLSKELLSESRAFFLGPPSTLPLPLISFAQASPLSNPALVPSQPTRCVSHICCYFHLHRNPIRPKEPQEKSHSPWFAIISQAHNAHCWKELSRFNFPFWLRSRKYMRDQDYRWLTFAPWILLSSWSFQWCRKSCAPTECIISLWKETHKTHQILKITFIQVFLNSVNHWKDLAWHRNFVMEALSFDIQWQI